MPAGDFLGWALLAALAASSACGPRDRRPGTPPRHVLLITAASLRADHLSCFLYPRPTSDWPSDEADRQAGRNLSLDDAAAQGVLFHAAFSPSNRTRAAAAALLSGQARAVEGDSDVLESDLPTIAETFTAAGFETVSFTSGIALNPGLGAGGFDRGFESSQYRFGDTAALTLALEWLTARQSSARPLFVWIHLSGTDPPHDPSALPPRPDGDRGAFDFGRYFEDPDYAGSMDGSLETLARIERGELELTPEDRRRLIDLYDAGVARLCSDVRTFLLSCRNLRSTPPGKQGGGDLLADSVLVFAGLHGIELGEFGRSLGFSSSMFEPVLRIPLFIRHPGSLTGARILAEPVGLEDVAPTLCDWFGLEPPAAAPRARAGRSLLPLVDSYVRRPFESRPYVSLCTIPDPAGSARTREWSLMWRKLQDTGESVSLFDRLEDPDELQDLSAARADVVLELLVHLRGELERAGWSR
jgi:hypothetical protein